MKKIQISTLSFIFAAVFLQGCDRSAGPVEGQDKNPGIVEQQHQSSIKETVTEGHQKYFEEIRTNFYQPYKGAINDIQKSAIFNKANSLSLEFVNINGIKIINWIGKIDSLSTSHGGSDVHVVIKSPGGSSYVISDDAKKDSSIYAQLSSLAEGQSVFFTAEFSGCDGKLECSLTELGSLSRPEYPVTFISIEPASGSPRKSSMSESDAQVEAKKTEGTARQEIAAQATADKEQTTTPPVTATIPSIDEKNCNSFNQAIGSIEAWKRSNVELVTIQENVSTALRNIQHTQAESNMWRDGVAAVFDGKRSGAELQAQIPTFCKTSTL